MKKLFFSGSLRMWWFVGFSLASPWMGMSMTTSPDLQAAQPGQPSAPQPNQPIQQPSGPETTESIEKIGTQGNWVKKRELLIKAHEANNEIQEVANQVEPIRKMFIDKNNEIDIVFDLYYKQLGLEQGKTQELFDSVFQYLEKKKKKELSSLIPKEGEQKDPDLQAKIDVLEEQIKLSKQQLEQLKLDMKSIEDLGNSLSERIKRVDEQINLINEDATRAQTMVNELWNIIDHTKARTIFYELKNNILEKIKNTESYLKEDLFNDFCSVIETIKKQITRTQDAVKKLEDEGIFVQNRAQRVKELKLKEIQLRKEEADKGVGKTPEQVKTKEPETWKAWLYQKLVYAGTKIYNTGTWLKSFFVKQSTPNLQMSGQTTKPPEQAPAAALPTTIPTTPPAPTTVPDSSTTGTSPMMPTS